MAKVPLVIYSGGERIVLGEAWVSARGEELVIDGVVFDKTHTAIMDSGESYSVEFTQTVGEPAEPREVAVIPPLKVKEQEDGTD